MPLECPLIDLLQLTCTLCAGLLLTSHWVLIVYCIVPQKIGKHRENLDSKNSNEIKIIISNPTNCGQLSKNHWVNIVIGTVQHM